MCLASLCEDVPINPLGVIQPRRSLVVLQRQIKSCLNRELGHI